MLNELDWSISAWLYYWIPRLSVTVVSSALVIGLWRSWSQPGQFPLTWSEKLFRLAILVCILLAVAWLSSFIGKPDQALMD
jgi:hypothetical protein